MTLTATSSHLSTLLCFTDEPSDWGSHTAAEIWVQDHEPRHVGPYRLEAVLGRGGQATVYRAVHRSTGQVVAVKVPRFDMGNREQSYFEREARITADLNHTGLGTVIGSNAPGEPPYLVMKYVGGRNLRQLMTEGRMGLEAVSMIEQAARALHVAHESGIVHRDIKPANIMIRHGGEAVVVDFGLAKDRISDMDSETVNGDLLGTPSYMSPEQVTGEVTEIDRRTDVWALGVTLYEALTGRRPFNGRTPYAVYLGIVNSPVQDPRKHNPSISSSLAQVVCKALAKNPADRYPTALALARALRTAQRRSVTTEQVGICDLAEARQVA